MKINALLCFVSNLGSWRKTPPPLCVGPFGEDLNIKDVNRKIIPTI